MSFRLHLRQAAMNGARKQAEFWADGPPMTFPGRNPAR
ncbi:hypothetical protein [Azospirillum palustre]